MTEIIEKPFDWNDNFAEIALEDFSLIQKTLSYGTATTIGMALAKLELLEKQGCKVELQDDNGFFDEIMDDSEDGVVYEKIKEIIEKVKEQEE
jgi:hypothetical protein